MISMSLPGMNREAQSKESGMKQEAEQEMKQEVEKEMKQEVKEIPRIYVGEQ